MTHKRNTTHRTDIIVIITIKPKFIHLNDQFGASAEQYAKTKKNLVSRTMFDKVANL